MRGIGRQLHLGFPLPTAEPGGTCAQAGKGWEARLGLLFSLFLLGFRDAFVETPPLVMGEVTRKKQEARGSAGGARQPDSASPPVQELPRLFVAWKSGRKGRGGGGWPEYGARAAAAFLLPPAPPRPSRREPKSRVASQAPSQGGEARRQSPPWPLR